ncbi:hypothetical protein EMCRGX_G008787 [Ephydatia muelleri]
MQVFQIAYCDIFKPSLADSCRDACHTFVNAAKRHMPTLLEKHLLLHLVDCMIQFGPSSAFSVERFESFNANVRTYNIFGNRLAPSWDIAQRFSTCSICATSVLMVWVPMKGVVLPLSMSTQCHLCSTWYVVLLCMCKKVSRIVCWYTAVLSNAWRLGKEFVE